MGRAGAGDPSLLRVILRRALIAERGPIPEPPHPAAGAAPAVRVGDVRPEVVTLLGRRSRGEGGRRAGEPIAFPERPAGRHGGGGGDLELGFSLGGGELERRLGDLDARCVGRSRLLEAILVGDVVLVGDVILVGDVAWRTEVWLEEECWSTWRTVRVDAGREPLRLRLRLAEELRDLERWPCES